MSETRTPGGADYLVDAEGTMCINEAGSGVAQAFREARHAFDELQRAWAGAYVAGLFMRYRWLQSLRITLTATVEYNDEGGTFQSVSSSVADLTFVPDATRTASTPGDDLDSSEAIEVIQGDLEENHLDLYTSILGDEDDCGELVLTLDRSVLDPMTRATPFSGIEAYRACFPVAAKTTNE